MHMSATYHEAWEADLPDLCLMPSCKLILDRQEIKQGQVPLVLKAKLLPRENLDCGQVVSQLTNRATPPKKKLTIATTVVAVIVPIFISVLCVLCYWFWRKRCRGTALPEECAQDQPPDSPDKSTSGTRWRFRGCFQTNNTGDGMQLGHLARVQNLYYIGEVARDFLYNDRDQLRL